MITSYKRFLPLFALSLSMVAGWVGCSYNEDELRGVHPATQLDGAATDLASVPVGIDATSHVDTEVIDAAEGIDGLALLLDGGALDSSEGDISITSTLDADINPGSADGGSSIDGTTISRGGLDGAAIDVQPRLDGSQGDAKRD